MPLIHQLCMEYNLPWLSQQQSIYCDVSSVSDSSGERGIGKDTNASLKDRNLLTNSVG